MCSQWFKAKEVQVDHIVPIGKFTTWDKVVEGMFVAEDKLQILCKPCHLEKGKEEKLNGNY